MPCSQYKKQCCNRRQRPEVIICQKHAFRQKTKASLTGLKPLLISYHCLLICSAAVNAKQFLTLPLYSKRKVGSDPIDHRNNQPPLALILPALVISKAYDDNISTHTEVSSFVYTTGTFVPFILPHCFPC